MQEFRSYVHLEQHKNNPESYELFVAIQLPQDHVATGLTLHSSSKAHNNKIVEHVKLKIDKGTSAPKIHHLQIPLINPRRNCVVVTLEGGAGVIITNPDEGAVANYEDPDGEF